MVQRSRVLLQQISKYLDGYEYFLVRKKVFISCTNGIAQVLRFFCYYFSPGGTNLGDNHAVKQFGKEL